MNAKRIVVVAPNWLGDAVMALPAIAAIRAAHPEAALVVAGRSSTVPLFTMVPGVDEVVRLDSRGGIIGAISWAEDAAALRTARADLAILLPNSFRSAWTAHRAGIPERWGYAADLRTRLLTRAVPRLRGAGVPEESGSRQMSRRRMPPRAEHHQGEYYLHLVKALLTGETPVLREPPTPTGETVVLPKTGGTPVLPKITASAEAQERATQLLSRLGIADGALLVGLAPGAAYGRAKQWPPERFAALAVDLHERLGATCLVFGARADKQASGVISRIVSRKLQNRKNEASAADKPAAADLAGQTDLPLLVALMARCRSVVSNDSGAMHVAAAAGVPVTAVFGSTDERGTAPLPSEVPGVPPHEILTSPAWCRPCMLRECPIDHRCMRGVDASMVAAAVERQFTGAGK